MAEQLAEAGLDRNAGGTPLLPEQGLAHRFDPQAAAAGGDEEEKAEIGAERRGDA